MVNSIVTTLVEVVTGIVSGIGDGISSLFEAIFMTGSGETATVSVLGVFIIALMGIGVALGIFRWVLSLIRNRG